jgi:hypothetical protein
LRDDSHHIGSIKHRQIFAYGDTGLSDVTCAFDASRFKVTTPFGVPISWAICTLSNIPFVSLRFDFDFQLLEIFHDEYVLIIWGWLQVYKEY